ncbi:UNVERIFIED_CONTAM: Transposon Ty2-B Gag-Pol polyprotein [Sesamum radiatum]|uniref:Transposon Ty2-B Gag-Pol polyprotein n=1 Tax=Sesamum radiatum TaxID=300843 RepID=A0AAW2L356_SESRA
MTVLEHGIKMLSLVEKLEDLQAGLDNDTYTDVILQLLPPLYDPFVVNYNMNELEKSINELINMLVPYEATTKKSEPSVLVGEASTSKAKGKGIRRWKRKKGKTKAVASALSTPVVLMGMGKGKGKVGFKPNKANDVCIHCREKGPLEEGVPQAPLQCRKLSRDEVVLKLGDGKAVAAEANGSSHLLDKLYNDLYILQQHDLIMTAQNKRKMDNQENAQIWHARLGHISQDRIKRLVDLKSLEINDLDHLPACESCMKGKMTKKSFVGQSTLASGLLVLIHSDIYGPLNTQARGRFSYFITFTDDHSRYSYVYLMRYKSEAFGRFKEFKLEIENQSGHKIKTI